MIEKLNKTSASFFGHLHPAKLVFLGYSSYILCGWLLLCLPFAQCASGVSSLDNLFTATSAVSTTGLVTVDISKYYNFLGQFIIMCLIQLGGIGYMTFGSFVILSRKANLSNLRSDVGRTVFSLPSSFHIDKFVRAVICFTLIIELLGAAALYAIFKYNNVENPLWSAIFHSVSAFCTAGFSLFSNSFEGFAGNFWLNLTIGVLSYLGAIGFIVCLDYWRMLRGEVKSITLTSKIILWATFWLSVVGTTIIFLVEPSIKSLPLDTRILSSFFQAMTAMTTVGFDTISIGGLSKASLLIIIILMIIGASPSGTGGGLKSTTFSAILGIMRSAMRGEKEVRFWGKVIPLERLWTAVAGLGFYLLALLIGTFLLLLTENFSFLELVFEASSALGTVGLSMGITAALSDVGKIVIILLMFCGRLGPLTFSIALFFKQGLKREEMDSDLAV